MRNIAIEGMRGYLILFIVLYHYTHRYLFYGNEPFCWETGFSVGKNLGVAGFFVISGFLMLKSLNNNAGITPPIYISPRKSNDYTYHLP